MAKYQIQEPRKGYRQAKLEHRGLLDGKITERIEWIPGDTREGETVQITGDTRYWTVVEIYKHVGV